MMPLPDEPMVIQEATEVERGMVREFVSDIRTALDRASPKEAEYPGATGLMVTALVHVAGELLRGVPPLQRPSVLAHYAGYLCAAAGSPESVN